MQASGPIQYNATRTTPHCRQQKGRCCKALSIPKPARNNSQHITTAHLRKNIHSKQNGDRQTGILSCVVESLSTKHHSPPHPASCTITTHNMGQRKSAEERFAISPPQSVNTSLQKPAGKFLHRETSTLRRARRQVSSSPVPFDRVLRPFCFFQRLTAGWRFWKTSCIVVFRTEGSQQVLPRSSLAHLTSKLPRCTTSGTSSLQPPNNGHSRKQSPDKNVATTSLALRDSLAI